MYRTNLDLSHRFHMLHLSLSNLRRFPDHPTPWRTLPHTTDPSELGRTRCVPVFELWNGASQQNAAIQNLVAIVVFRQHSRTEDGLPGEAHCCAMSTVALQPSEVIWVRFRAHLARIGPVFASIRLAPSSGRAIPRPKRLGDDRFSHVVAPAPPRR